LLSDEILLAVREWERERMGITKGDGQGMGIKLGKTWDREWEWNEPLGMGGNGIEKDISAHLY